MTHVGHKISTKWPSWHLGNENSDEAHERRWKDSQTVKQVGLFFVLSGGLLIIYAAESFYVQNL